jgi:hypothetical protein
VSQLVTKTTLAITSVVQCTPSSTRENAVAATASPAVSQAAIDAALRRASAATHSARIAKARHAAAEWPEGNDHPRAWTSQMARGGRRRPTTALPIATPPASPAHANTATMAARTGRRLVMTSTEMMTAVTRRATHEPSQVMAFMAELRAGVRQPTTTRAAC